jgi:RND superfamily putative drug exporter
VSWPTYPLQSATGLTTSARIIGPAAAIMVAVALGFALDPSVMVKLIGVGLTTAILIDVTLARLVVVPAAMALLGKANWYFPGLVTFARPAPSEG